VGHALVVWGAEELNPFLVIAIASVANTIAEWTSYWAGMTGKTAAEVRPVSLPGALGRFARWSWGMAERLMERHGFATLLVLSAVPNPVFEVSGIIAGANRMDFGRFNLALMIGHTLRVVSIVLIGHEIVEWADI
jgi:membrane protein DedA with SNARE-associated domain